MFFVLLDLFGFYCNFPLTLQLRKIIFLGALIQTFCCKMYRLAGRLADFDTRKLTTAEQYHAIGRSYRSYTVCSSTIG